MMTMNPATGAVIAVHTRAQRNKQAVLQCIVPWGGPIIMIP